MRREREPIPRQRSAFLLVKCPDCGEEIRFQVRGNRPDDESLLFHCLVPAAHWWDDIVFT